MNAPNLFQDFVAQKCHHLPLSVTYVRETNIACAGRFTIQREGHTLSNLLEMQLHRDPDVMFSGYKVPSPLELKVELRIQTTLQSTRIQAYNQAINDLDNELEHLKLQFEVQGSALFFSSRFYF
ncbi:DNA-directed RNA Polymerase II subunit [Musa troglodytarum]|uniref:DNA-directed RNA Polymerase II subunit n=1 Tax=Musa troglodytarum TaxID=320322 RepID=A0A9E7ESP5_9LILI|nr:DNA-directed RNA Polymerase II subunit [Musa troglodytarum]